MDHDFEKYPNWQPEEQVDKGIATLIHKYMKVKRDTFYSGIECLQSVIHILSKWVKKEQKDAGTQSLM